MKYSLRSLMIVALVGPPVLALAVILGPTLMAMAWPNRDLLAFGFAVLTPLLLIPKWRIWGVACSVLIGWGVIYGAHLSVPWREPVDPVFAGVWLAAGPAFMILWCLPIYGAVVLYDALKRRSEPVP